MSLDDRIARVRELTPEQRRELLARKLCEKQIRRFPLSFEQLRLWFLTQLNPDSPLYNDFVLVRLAGRLDRPALQRALEAVVARHEVLRVHFELRAGDPEPEQVAGPPGPVPVDEIDLTGIHAARRQEETVRQAVAFTNRPFDLSRGPLFRVRLMRLGERDHALLFAVHHTVYDGWSSGLICSDLATLYDAFASGKTSPLEPLPMQYGEYAAWQRDRIRGETLEQLLEYWRGTLEGTSALELPCDHLRPAESDYTGAREWLMLPDDLARGLETLSRESAATLFMTVLAAYKVVLHRYSGQDDIAIGSLFANRNRSDVERLVGCFVNTLVLRTDLSGDPTFRELLDRVRDVTLEAFEHRDLPFERLVEELQPARNLGRNPLFDVSFVLMTGARPELKAADLKIEEFAIDPETSRFDLEAYVFRRPNGMEVLFNYRTDLFETATVRRMLEHLRVLIEGIVADPDRRLSELPLLTSDERSRILVEWNATDRDFPRDLCVHELFEAQARRSPDAVAAEFETQRLTYAELDARANRLARHLRERGVRAETRVALCLERSMDLLVGVLATLKAGGAYVPLDPWLPGARLEGMLEDSRPAAVLTESCVLENVSEVGAYADSASAPVIRVDGDAEEIAGHAPESPAIRVDPENLAYVIYTSGSTGRPKGVGIPHRAVVNFLESMRREPGLEEEDTWLAVTNLTFDIAVLELMLPLAVGARVVVASRETAADGLRLKDKLAESGATVMQATPATWRMLVQSGWFGTPGLKMLCGGEALPRPLALELLDRGSELWNMYGPTETTIWSSVARVRRRTGPISIGRPIDNTRIYVLDPNLDPVPIGVAGELYIGGAGLARGYHARPDLTACSFVPSAFGDEAGDRLYRTGDSVRYRADGSLEFLGRNDHQVKLRGFRIELGEIEATLLEHPEVRECVVHPFEPAPDDRRLAAYVVTANGSPPSVDELRSFLRQSLPEYMVPAAFVTLDELPLTPNGKVNRRELSVPKQAQSAPGSRHAPPETPTETLLAEIWQEVLRVDRVGVQDNFFDLGGHSLLTVQVSMKVHERTGRRVELRDYFLQTLGQIAASLDAAPKEQGEKPGSGLFRGVRSVMDRIVGTRRPRDDKNGVRGSSGQRN